MILVCAGWIKVAEICAESRIIYLAILVRSNIISWYLCCFENNWPLLRGILKRPEIGPIIIGIAISHRS